MVDWNELIKYFFTLFVGSGTIGFIVRGMFNYFLKRDIEGYKSKLNILSKQREISFAKLYNERAEAIREIYSKLYLTENSFTVFHSPIKAVDSKPLSEIGKSPETFDGKTEIEQGNFAAKNYNELKIFFEKNKILFEEELCLKIENILSEFYDIRGEFERLKLYKNYPQEEYKKLNEAWERLTVQIPLLKKNLEVEFRKLLRHEINLNEISF